MNLTEQSKTQQQTLVGGLPRQVVEPVALGPDDFQRIGLHPRETRLAVIRRAASRTAKSLAHRQLAEPNPMTEQQLSRVALSTYRLLDPRQRGDRHSRAHVGRIRPGALQRAGHTEFPRDGDLLGAAGSSASDVCPSEYDAGELDEEKIYVGSLDLQEFLPESSRGLAVQAWRELLQEDAASSWLNRLRRWINRPALIFAMIAILLISAAVTWQWGQRWQSLRGRLTPMPTPPVQAGP